MKALVVLMLTSLLPCAASAATTVSYTYAINTQIPDNSGIGLTNTQQVTVSVSAISEVTVLLSVSEGWCGDLYAYLTHGSGFSVLLNRPGRSLADPFGSGVTDLTVTFNDNAPADNHTGIPTTGAISGVYQPDGRAVDPDNSLDTSPRTAFLSSFNGLDANGEWTLYVADVATGDTMTLVSWSLNITGVPEPSTLLLGAAGGCLVLRRRRGETFQRMGRSALLRPFAISSNCGTLS
jgi:subtilisin-like proprotein convertase family protein